MEPEKAAFLQQSFNNLAHDMDQMQSFCFDLKVNILHSEVATFVYVCKCSFCLFYVFELCSFSHPTPPKKKYTHNTPDHSKVRSLYICQICFNVYNFFEYSRRLCFITE